MGMSGNGPAFVKWSEEFVSQERGRRIVHYYLEDACGDSYLAVVGTERSLRHMLYVVSEEFCQVYGSDKLRVSSLKWRSRREVVDWLASFLPAKVCSPRAPKLPKCALKHVFGANMEPNKCKDAGGNLINMDDNRKSDIVWSGASWTCGKQLQHYRAFCRNGTTIRAHSFVFVMAEEENRYLAYLEDMYEDKKGAKKVKVRWFHQNQEFACMIPAPAPHPCEVFITPYSQVISAECVDGIATVLTLDHYDKWMESFPSAAGVLLCFRQYSKNKFKPFDLRTLRGYFNQTVMSCFDLCNETGKGEAETGYDSMKEHIGPRRTRFLRVRDKFFVDRLDTKISTLSGRTSCRPYQNVGYDLLVRRPLSVKFVGPRNWLSPLFKVGEKIEVLCQDSGIRGCWFKCTVLELSHKKLKVRYDDVQNVDGYGNLEEWIPAFRTAAPDRFGLRCPGRPTVRPSPKCIHLIDNIHLRKGMSVDVNWSDGWWEAVVIELANKRDDSVQLYLPGEGIFLICELKRLRISKDWMGNEWVDIIAKPDILSAIPSVSPGLASCSLSIKRAESGSSVMLDQEIITTQVNSVDEEKQVDANLTDHKTSPQLNNEKQTNPRKRPRDEDAHGDCRGGQGTGSDVGLTVDEDDRRKQQRVEDDVGRGIDNNAD